MHQLFLGGLTLTAIDRLGWLVPQGVSVRLTRLRSTAIRVFPRICRPPEQLAARFALPMHVTREGPDVLSRYCPVQAFGVGGSANTFPLRSSAMQVEQSVTTRFVIGGVDTHKDLHVAAVVDEHNRVLGVVLPNDPARLQADARLDALFRPASASPAACIRGATGTYGAGLLRYLQNAGVEVLEVTTPDGRDRRKRGKNDDLDAQNAAHAAFAGKRTVTPKTR